MQKRQEETQRKVIEMCEKCDEMQEFMEKIEDVGITLPLQHFFAMMSLIKASLDHEDYETTNLVVDSVIDKIKNDAENLEKKNFTSNLQEWE